MAAFREAVQIIHRMWTEDRPVFSGKHYTIDKPINEPKSAAPGRKVPLWIGGDGEKVTLRLVAQYGDACNVGGGNPEVIKRKIDILHGHCEREGRNFDDIVKSTSYNFFPVADGADPEAATARVREGYGGMDLATFSEKVAPVKPTSEIAEAIQAGADAGADYAINYIPGLAYDLDPLHVYEEGGIAHLAS